LPSPEHPVSDASPLIFLARADELSLLRVVAETVLVPRAVAQEIEAKGDLDVAVRALRKSTWFEIVESAAPPPEIREWDLGKGEAAVLTWAWSHPGTLAIIDDREARRCARSIQVPLIGTLGVVLKAKSEGLVPMARPVIERLLDCGMYLSRQVIDSALALVGE
jgi:predicted nucleic acid-binding protein